MLWAILWRRLAIHRIEVPGKECQRGRRMVIPNPKIPLNKHTSVGDVKAGFGCFRALLIMLGC